MAKNKKLLKEFITSAVGGIVTVDRFGDRRMLVHAGNVVDVDDEVCNALDIVSRETCRILYRVCPIFLIAEGWLIFSIKMEH